MSVQAAPAPFSLEGVRVKRSARPTAWLLVPGAALLAVLAAMPSLVSTANTDLLVNVFILLTVSAMWNLLAGYAGMISIGQQAFIGLGAYSVLVIAMGHVSPFAAIPLAMLVCGALAIPISYVVFRLRGGYFAIATWVVAETARLIISSIQSLGGGTGKKVQGLSGLSPKAFTYDTYWAALVVAVLAVGGSYLVLRSRLGLQLSAMRDNEIGARSAGVRVDRARRIVFVVAALGCAGAGALLAVSQLQVQPTSVFSVQWSAEMIFACLIGGLGTLEGPLVGTVIFFVLQQNLSSHGAWYLIIFGSAAVVIAIWLPRGLWGSVVQRTRLEVLPVGYHIRGAKQAARGKASG
ncbi:MAG TPA: branched-chain amino acid ABC transporter permease [Acidimicrobiales bacterium]|nr:branched-chain amino acid ABC transporter permease [Acidimicrobiales bacterium]